MRCKFSHNISVLCFPKYSEKLTELFFTIYTVPLCLCFSSVFMYFQYSVIISCCASVRGAGYKTTPFLIHCSEANLTLAYRSDVSQGMLSTRLRHCVLEFAICRNSTALRPPPTTLAKVSLYSAPGQRGRCKFLQVDWFSPIHWP